MIGVLTMYAILALVLAVGAMGLLNLIEFKRLD
jgi:hypothetical protein